MMHSCRAGLRTALRSRCAAGAAHRVTPARGLASAAAEDKKFYLLTYDYVDGIVDKRGPHRAGHLAHAKAAIARGDVVLGGAFADLTQAGIVFRVADAAEVEAFVEGDPYVAAGLVTDHSVREWTVVVGEEGIEGIPTL